MMVLTPLSFTGGDNSRALFAKRRERRAARGIQEFNKGVFPRQRSTRGGMTTEEQSIAASSKAKAIESEFQSLLIATSRKWAITFVGAVTDHVVIRSPTTTLSDHFTPPARRP